MLLLYDHLQDKYSVIIHPKDSASELGPNGMSCFIVKINPSLNTDISVETPPRPHPGWLNGREEDNSGFLPLRSNEQLKVRGSHPWGGRLAEDQVGARLFLWTRPALSH